MTSTTDNLDPTCSEIRERIPLFIGGDLDLGVLESVSEHLQRCPSCTAACEQAQRGREALVATLRQREPDYRKPNLWGGVRAALLQEGVLPEAPKAIGSIESAPALPGRGPSLSPSVSLQGAAPSGGDWTEHPERASTRRSGSLLRRASAWVPLAAAACALFFFGPDFSGGGGAPTDPASPSGPGLANHRDASPDRPVETLPAPAASFLAGNTGAVPINPVSSGVSGGVSSGALRKIQPGQVLLSEEARVDSARQGRVDQAQGKLPSVGELAGWE